MQKIKIILIIFTISYFILSSSFHQRLGNVFFGKIPSLYNVTLAQFFFNAAANPLFGKPEPFSNHQLSRTYFVTGRLPEALATAQKELEFYPEHKGTYYVIGLILGYLNLEEKAIEAFSSYIEYNPKTWAAKNDKAWLQFRIGDIDGALETIKQVATSTGLDNPWVQNTYGTLLMNKGRYQESQAAFLLAKNLADQMDESAWGKAYPGNDPRIYSRGLYSMRKSIDKNLETLSEKSGI